MKGNRGLQPYSMSFSTADEQQFYQRQIEQLEEKLTFHSPAQIAQNYFIGIQNYSKSAWLRQTINDLHYSQSLHLKLLTFYNEKKRLLTRDIASHISAIDSKLGKMESDPQWREHEFSLDSHQSLVQRKTALEVQLGQLDQALQRDIKEKQDWVNKRLQEVQQLLTLFNAFSTLKNALLQIETFIQRFEKNNLTARLPDTEIISVLEFAERFALTKSSTDFLNSEKLLNVLYFCFRAVLNNSSAESHDSKKLVIMVDSAQKETITEYSKKNPESIPPLHSVDLWKTLEFAQKSLANFTAALESAYANKVITLEYTSSLISQVSWLDIKVTLATQPEKSSSNAVAKMSDATILPNSEALPDYSTVIKRGTFPTVNLSDKKEIDRLINYVQTKEAVLVEPSWGYTVNVLSQLQQTATYNSQALIGVFVERTSNESYESTVVRLNVDVDRQLMIKNALLHLQSVLPAMPIEDQAIINHLLSASEPNQHLQFLTREFKCHEISQNLSQSLGNVALSSSYLTTLLTSSDSEFPQLSVESAERLAILLVKSYQDTCQYSESSIPHFKFPAPQYLELAMAQYEAFLNNPVNKDTPPTLATGSDPQLIKAWILITDSWNYFLKRDNDLINETPYVLNYPDNQKMQILQSVLNACPVSEKIKTLSQPSTPPSSPRQSLS